MNLHNLLHTISESPISIMDASISLSQYYPIDLSSTNKDLETIDITDPWKCQTYIKSILSKANGIVAYGGYLEKRNLYSSADRFSIGEPRSIHLGVDFWCAAGTKVITPIKGIVHSFKNNADSGNYGPTIILEHIVKDITFYSLYGHLSLESLGGLYIGKQFNKGEILATLGDTPINVNYAPHLHFQLIDDVQKFKGDYPGVCSNSDLSFYQNNCPDPNLLLGLY
ncbi:peptidoglycan DD-metalloendopeptidase family protein [Croceitalea rosinachiae]|uniref:Peptidoglycan DD-metalloendopeptidase family protein n=1 Tax=Croceitalea rosinachiae TaxID=3075596 RepID=A0ABU3A9S5_9FLAO|nr:peptidoglycan DD-metalloendopeptidase family protein [Croceitalea sp. F388]MDT0606940.1 peptidoglycan DD-metalloendopeptidase family protein [Croceitalea sp. F388]